MTDANEAGEGNDAESGVAGTGTAWEAASDRRRVTFYVRGKVQGVGFRWWLRARALEVGVTGHARNTADGRVEVLAQGEAGAIAALVARVREDPSTTGRPGRVDSVSTPVDGPPRADLVTFVER